MKLLKLQKMHPWCFHFLGNPISCLQFQEEEDRRQHRPNNKRVMMRRRRRTIKLIKSDGVVKIYDRPIHASELMMEFPKHLVCRSDSFYIGQKIPPLSENDKLQFGHNYFLLPNHCFQTVLSFVTVASFASRTSFLNKASSSPSSSCQLFDIQRSPSGCSRIRVSDEFISQLMTKEEEEGSRGEDDEAIISSTISKVCTTPQLHKVYTQLVGGGRLRRWKPKLETIKEKKEKKRLSSFGIGIGNGKRRKNKLLVSQKNQKSTVPDHPFHNVITSSNSKSSKIKIKSRI